MARISKAQQELEALRLHCDRIETQLASAHAENEALTAKVAELREFAARQVAAKRALLEASTIRDASPQNHNKPQPQQFSDYVAYCSAARAWCRQQGHKVISMASREQFEAAQPCPV